MPDEDLLDRQAGVNDAPGCPNVIAGNVDWRVPVEPDSSQWTDGSGNPVTDISIDVPANDAECTGGDWRKCPCASCTARQTLEHIRNHPPFQAPPITTPGFPSPGRPNPPKDKPEIIHKVEERKGFAKRSKRWGK